jgi:hypothetical protein
MSTISDVEMAEIRADALERLRDTGRILTYSSKSDGAGGEEETHTPGEPLPCAIAPMGRVGKSQTAGSRISEASTHVATWPADAAIDARDRVEIGGVIYAITGLRQFGAMAATRRVEVKVL